MFVFNVSGSLCFCKCCCFAQKQELKWARQCLSFGIKWVILLQIIFIKNLSSYLYFNYFSIIIDIFITFDFLLSFSNTFHKYLEFSKMCIVDFIFRYLLIWLDCFSSYLFYYLLRIIWSYLQVLYIVVFPLSKNIYNLWLILLSERTFLTRLFFIFCLD